MVTTTLRKAIYVRKIGLVMAFGLLLFLTGCSDDQGKSETPVTPESATQPSPTQPPGEPTPTQPAPAGEGGPCSTLMTAKCIECHTLARICEKLGKKSKARWRRTMDRMIERGAKVTPTEHAALLVCLENGATNDLQEACR